MSLILPFRLRSGAVPRGTADRSRALVVAATAGASPWPFGAFTTRQQGAPWWALLLSGLGLGTAVALLLRLLSWWRTCVGVPRFIGIMAMDWYLVFWSILYCIIVTSMWNLKIGKLDTAGFTWHKFIQSTSFFIHLRCTLHLYIHFTRHATLASSKISPGIIPSFKLYASCVCRETRWRLIGLKFLLQVLHAWRSW